MNIDPQWMKMPNGERPPEPKIEISDEAGNIVFQATMEYG